MSMFNEDSLRADIVKIWGEHGAHIDVYDMIVKMAKQQPGREVTAEEVTATKEDHMLGRAVQQLERAGYKVMAPS